MLELEDQASKLPHNLAWGILTSWFCQPSPKPSFTNHSRVPKLLSIQSQFPTRPQDPPRLQTVEMINAVLVFNNSGQPRLTKFYTQLVGPGPLLPKGSSNKTTGNIRPAAPHLRNLPTSIPPLTRLLQLPPPPPSPRTAAILPTYRLNTTQRRPIARHLPALRHPLLHNHIHIDGIAAGAHRPDPGVRGGAGPAV